MSRDTKGWGALEVENHGLDWANVIVQRVIPQGFAAPAHRAVAHQYIEPGRVYLFRLTPGCYVVCNGKHERREVRVYDRGRRSLVMLMGLPR
jgi:hypothetical protein